MLTPELTLLPPPRVDNPVQRDVREQLALALHRYYQVLFRGHQCPVQSWDDLTWAEQTQAIRWVYEAEYAVFLRPRVQVDLSGIPMTDGE